MGTCKGDGEKAAFFPLHVQQKISVFIQYAGQRCGITVFCKTEVLGIVSQMLRQFIFRESFQGVSDVCQRTVLVYFFG